MLAAGAFGIMGLGFNLPRDSPIQISLSKNISNDTALSRNPIGNIFAQNPSSPNILSVLLDRADDPESSTGIFAIGEYAQGCESVMAAPRLPRFVPAGQEAGARWSILLDGFKVNGRSIELNSSFTDAPKGKVVSVLDTGATNPQIPAQVANSIYEGIDGAFFSKDVGSWIVPCTGSANVTLEWWPLGGYHPRSRDLVSHVQVMWESRGH